MLNKKLSKKDEYWLFLRLIKQRKGVLINKYQNQDVLELLNQWCIDKKRRDYHSILDELLDTVSLENQILFLKKWHEELELISLDYHFSDPSEEPYEWSRSVRIGEMMINEAIELSIWDSAPDDDLLHSIKKILPEGEVERLIEKYQSKLTMNILARAIKYFYID
jgi:hypothetical protein